jgi:hypothetical protein
MTNPIGSSGQASGSFPSSNDPNMPPPGPPLPINDPWVVALQRLFPNVPVAELQLYASKFRDNMFQALNSQIQRDLKKARESARKFKESIEGND